MSADADGVPDDVNHRRRHAGDEPALIQVDDVFRRYPSGVEALRGVSLVAHEGEVVCIIGPSGSGKSTLLRCVNGLEPIDRGRILVGGRRHRTRIDDYDGSLLRRISPSQAALFELAFESRAIRLRGATAEIFYVITGHILMLTQ